MRSLNGKRLLQRYVLTAVLPYILLALLLLTGILFVQQTGRFAEILVSARVPLSLFGNVSLGLLPNILVFTVPMAVLAGAIVGFSRLGSDSEMAAIRNAGVGTWSIAWPVLSLGLIITIFTFYLNFEVAPQSAVFLKQAGIEAALSKLESPIEPRTFSVEIPNYVVYVKDGDKEKGTWGRIFIQTTEKDGGTRVITAKSGRLDSQGEKTELVLDDAVSSKLPASDNKDKQSFVVERLETLRVTFETGRKQLMSKLQDLGKDLEQAGFRELVGKLRTPSSKPQERREVASFFHRRLSLAISPLVFAFLGVAIGLRLRKGGRGLGIFLSISVMLGYYLLLIIGAQMSRAGTVPPLIGAWFATGVTLVLASLLMIIKPGGARISTLFSWVGRGLRARGLNGAQSARSPIRSVSLSFPSLMDSTVFRSLGVAFAISLATLVGIFIIFTVFELWRFLATSGSGISLLFRYIFFLLPFVLVQLSPAATLIAVLATYALIARRRESIAWLSAGQSIYRLILPAIVFGTMMAVGVWFVQDRIMPGTNAKQDALRAQLKSSLQVNVSGDKQWLASVTGRRLYSYEYFNRPETVEDLTIYEFDPTGTHLTRIVKGKSAQWSGQHEAQLSQSEAIDFGPQKATSSQQVTQKIEDIDGFPLFKPTGDKPSQLNLKQLSEYIAINKQRGVDITELLVALYRKQAEPFGALVMTLLGAPIALAYGRRNVVTGLCIAIFIGIAFWGVTAGFQQLGAFGMLPASIAAWVPVAVFGSAGIYFLARTKT